MRLDKWLWAVRIAKSRSLAQKLCEGGHVRVNGATVRKSHHALKQGDALDITRGHMRFRLTVLAFREKRVGATDARTCYAFTEDPENLKPPQHVDLSGRSPGSGRPTKRERRQLDALIIDWSRFED